MAGHRTSPDSSVEGYPWLVVTAAEHVDDLKVVADLGQRYPTPPDKDRGEVEMVALCSRHGWIAVCEDEVGRTQAADYGVDRIYIVTLLAAAAAYKLVPHKDAWAAHEAVESSRGYRSILRGDDDHRAVFADVVRAFYGLSKAKGDPPLHDFLRLPGMVWFCRCAADKCPSRTQLSPAWGHRGATRPPGTHANSRKALRGNAHEHWHPRPAASPEATSNP